MSRGRRALLILAGLQLVLVGLGAAHIRLTRLGPAGFLVDSYAVLTGAGANYGFFAPGIGSELGARFEVEQPDGAILVDSLESRGTREIALRAGNIVRAFGDEVEHKEVRRALAASWAGKILARHPGASAVTVRIENYDLPNMRDYARGARPHWSPFYTARFELAADPTTPEAE